MEDSIYRLKKYYDHSPLWLKRFTGSLYRCVPIAIRYGKGYRYYRDLLKESQWWSKRKLEEYQTERLKELINNAYENVPYYRRIFDERGLKSKNIQNLSDLQKLPFLTKELVRENLSNLIAKNYSPEKLLYQTTGGSTGAPLIFYHEKGVGRSKEVAFFESLWSRVGYRWWKDRIVSLRGEMIKSKKDNKFWEYEPIRNNLVLSVYHMTEENLLHYIEKIRKFRPKFFYAYPSAITILAKFMKKNNFEPFDSLEAILCGSEHLFPYQRELLYDAFGCKILNWYGMGEKVVLAGSCEKSGYYHIFPEYGITELIGGNGKPVSQEDEIGEIVGTVFDNDIMPFIRYRTGDLGVHTNKKCNCGRNYPLLKSIEGRTQEFIVSKSGNLISLNGLMISLDSNVFAPNNECWRNILQFQFIQEAKGKLILKVVKNTAFSLEKAKRCIKDLFEERLQATCDLDIKFADNISKTKRGKHKFLVQKLNISDYETF